MRRRSLRALAAVPAGLIALASLAACGGDGDDSDDAEAVEDLDTTTTAGGDDETTTSTEELTPEEQVWVDLTSAYEAVAALAAAPDPEAPELAEHFTGDSLAGYQDAMRDMQAGGGAQTTISLHRYSVSVGGEAATAEYCFVDTSQYLDTAGQPAGAPEETSMRATSQLELIDGTWKMSQSTIEPETCPAS